MDALQVTPGHQPVVAQVATPAPGTDEVLIKVLASTLNPVDAQTAQGIYHQLGWASLETVGLGWDVVGEVVELGDGVTGPAIGSLVAGLDPQIDAPTKTHAQFAALPAENLALVPDGLDPVAAATVPLNALTAKAALEAADIGQGRLLVTGAAGAVGGYAVALAAQQGIDVTGLARSSDEEFVRSTGAEFTDHAVAGFDVVLDAAVMGEAAVALVTDGGRYVGVVPPATPDPERGITVEAVMVAPDGPALAELLDQVAAGKLATRVAEVLPLSQAPQALASLGEGGRRGRLVVQP
ncbi:NADP-dependent oxidoreductase [Dermacoccaceae bacterium W4C1]